MLLRLEGEIRLGYEGLYHITKVLRVNKVDSGIFQIAANQFAYNWFKSVYIAINEIEVTQYK